MKIKNIKILKESYDRWDLEVESTHNFVVENCVVHNCNSRVAFIDGKYYAGSKNFARKVPKISRRASVREAFSNLFKLNVESTWKDLFNIFRHEDLDISTLKNDRFAYPLHMKNVQDMLIHYGKMHKSIILYGECYGAGIQTFTYGSPKELSYRAFDLSLDGKYVDYNTFCRICDSFNIPRCDEIYLGQFDLEAIRKVAQGNSLVPGVNHIREGVVVKPLIESNDPNVKGGRVIFKCINPEYLLKKYSNDPVSDYTEN